MERILADIQSGSFAREWIAESRSGGHRFEALRKAGAAHPIEQVGAKLRAMMPWTEEGKGARGSGLGARSSDRTPQPPTPRPRTLRARPHPRPSVRCGARTSSTRFPEGRG